jgi:hypothetical protein
LRKPDNDDFADGERQQWVGLLEGNWLIRQKHNLKISAEYFDPDDDLDEDERTRYSLVYEHTRFNFYNCAPVPASTMGFHRTMPITGDWCSCSSARIFDGRRATGCRSEDWISDL